MAGNETFTYGIQITSDSSGAIKDFKAGGNSADKFAKSLSDLDKKSGKSGKTFKSTGKDVGKLQKGFREAAASAALLEGPLGGVAGRLSAMSAVAGRGNLALAGLGVGFAATTFFGTKAIRVYAETEHQLAQLSAQLELTGFASGFTADQLDLMARGIARSTLASTGDIREAISVMLTFTSVTGDVFQDAIQASNNLAQVMGGSVKSAAVQLGKALEDPRVGLTALRRSGVSFTSEQRALIISLVDAGRKSEAMAEALKVLDSQLPDAAKGVGELKGAFDSLGQSYDELLETLGSNGTLRDLTLAFTTGITVLADNFKEFIDPQLETEVNTLLAKRLTLLQQIAKEGRRQGENTAVTELADIDRQLKVLQEKRLKNAEQTSKKLAQGEARRQQVEQGNVTRLLLAREIKESTIRARTATSTGAAVTKIESQILSQRLAGNRITIEQHNRQLTELRLQQNQREVDALRGLRDQLENEEATPIVKFRADENIKRKEIERQFILKQGVIDLALARKKAAEARVADDAKVSQVQQRALKSLQSAQIELLKATGNQAEAAEQQITQRYQTMLDNLTGKSKVTGQQIVSQLISKEKTQIALNELERQVNNTLDSLGNQERSIDISVDNGLFTETEGRQKLLDIHRETSVVLGDIVSKMEALAVASGNQQAINLVGGLKNKVKALSTETTVLETQVRDGLNNAFSSVFRGMGRDINGAEEAVKAFTLSVLDSISEVLAAEAAAAATRAAIAGVKAFSNIFHTGGNNLTGRTGKQVEVNPGVFAAAPRLHSGLQQDEFPAILQTGEDVIARNDPRNSRFGSGTGKTTNLSITVPVTIEGGVDDQAKLQGISRLLKTAITSELVKQKRQGGLLAK